MIFAKASILGASLPTKFRWFNISATAYLLGLFVTSASRMPQPRLAKQWWLRRFFIFHIFVDDILLWYRLPALFFHALSFRHFSLYWYPRRCISSFFRFQQRMPPYAILAMTGWDFYRWLPFHHGQDNTRGDVEIDRWRRRLLQKGRFDDIRLHFPRRIAECEKVKNFTLDTSPPRSLHLRLLPSELDALLSTLLLLYAERKWMVSRKIHSFALWRYLIIDIVVKCFSRFVERHSLSFSPSAYAHHRIRRAARIYVYALADFSARFTSLGQFEAAKCFSGHDDH